MSDAFTSPQRRGRNVFRLALATLIVSIVALLWQWQGMRTLQTDAAAQQRQIDARLADIAAQESALREREQQLEQALATLSAGHAGVARRVDTLYGAHRSGLLAAEAEHLARLAAQRLTLMQDPVGALAMLDAADAALRDIRDADTHAARAALAQDRARLREAAQVDIEAAWLRLATLAARADALAARAPATRPQTRSSDPEQAVAETTTGWQRFRAALLSLVSVRRVDEPLTPALTAGARDLAAQNFRLLVEQAQLALLQRRGGLYRQALDEADRWLERLTVTEAAMRTTIRQELANLQSLDVGRPLPDLTGTLAATRALALRLLPETAAADTAP